MMKGTMSHVMDGAPLWFFLLGALLVLSVTFFVTDKFVKKINWSKKINLIGNKKIYRLIKWRGFQAIPQLATVALFCFTIFAGLFGDEQVNFATSLVWTVWWAWLAITVTLFGPVPCFLCPWDGLTNLLTRFPLYRKVTEISLNNNVPKYLKNLFPAIFLFIIFTWLELIYGATKNPKVTAYMGIAMAMGALIFVLLFPKKVFCKYICLVGRISGLYSNLAPVEIRSKKPEVCASCRSEECLNGSKKSYPCPTGLSLKSVSEATFCIQCTECIKGCPYENVGFNLRLPGSDIKAKMENGKLVVGRIDEAWMMITMLALTLFHGLGMTTVWENFAPGEMSIMRFLAVHLSDNRMLNSTFGIVCFCGLLALLYSLSSMWAKKLAGVPDGFQEKDGFRALFIQLSFPLLPTTVAYHIAHNLGHIVMEGFTFLAIMSDPLGRGADYLGTKDFLGVGMLSGSTLWVLQVAIIILGHALSIILTHRVVTGLYSDKKKARLAAFPMLIMSMILSVLALTLSCIDMNMRMTYF
ncbi:MAG: hypothetical protein HYV97_11935 [Bdellovibrio sp.]|nr:hypothetical protein [Bdellovibrio sp.]